MAAEVEVAEEEVVEEEEEEVVVVVVVAEEEAKPDSSACRSSRSDRQRCKSRHPERPQHRPAGPSSSHP